MQPYKLDYTGEEVNDAIGDVLNGRVSGGTQSNWNQNDETQVDYIQNRPGGYYQTVQGVGITWDGVIGDRPKVELDEGVYLVKVSDEVLTAEQLIGAKMTVVSDGKTDTATVASSAVEDGGGYAVVAYRSLPNIISTTVLQVGEVTFPETGTYFVSASGDYTLYISSIQKAEHQALVPIPGELTNLKGGYDLPAISNQPVYSGTVPASAFSVATQAAQGGEIAVQTIAATVYSAPITLTNPLAEGATVSGTVNGTAVSGVVTTSGGDLEVALYTGSGPKKVAVQSASGGVLVCVLTSDAVIVRNNPPETDMVLALSQSRKATPKVIPAEYLDVDVSALESRIDEVEAAVSNAQFTADSAQVTANAAATSHDPVVTGSFSQNRRTSSAIGPYSHTEGTNCTASGTTSHAEGNNCTASGNSSHAEGANCIASGNMSHAEGLACEATQPQSHAEGMRALAHSQNQHVQGKYNIVDTSNKYAHIVGNGSNIDHESNAHTLDWNGVPWYQGRPQFGGTAQDNGSQTVMANGDKEIILASSTAGSTKKFKITVDDTGTLKVTEVTA